MRTAYFVNKPLIVSHDEKPGLDSAATNCIILVFYLICRGYPK